MPLTQESWGEVKGEPVSLFTLTNANGVSAQITNYGGILTNLKVPGQV